MSQNWMRHFELQLLDQKGSGISLSDFKVTFRIEGPIRGGRASPTSKFTTFRRIPKTGFWAASFLKSA